MYISKTGRQVEQLLKRFSLITLSVALALGCSIKEERDGCPCRLFLDLTSIDVADQCPFFLSVFSDDGFEYQAVLDKNNFEDTCVVEVPRTELDIVVWSGGEDYMDERGLTIPLGSECPPVFIYSKSVHSKGEAVYDMVFLKKNYCILNLDFEDGHRVESLLLRGNVNGFDKSGNPVRGEFNVSSESDSVSVASAMFSIPRQNDSPLYLDVKELDGMTRTFPLHEYMSDFGYDWGGNDLVDLNMTLSYTASEMSITIRDWEKELVISVVI